MLILRRPIIFRMVGHLWCFVLAIALLESVGRAIVPWAMISSSLAVGLTLILDKKEITKNDRLRTINFSLQVFFICTLLAVLTILFRPMIFDEIDFSIWCSFVLITAVSVEMIFHARMKIPSDE
jgi:hypothetical protein